ncbi:MAG: HEAT repeat domain-containing protein [Chthonomonadales bacterium]
MVVVKKPGQPAKRSAAGHQRPGWLIVLAAGILVTIVAGLLYTHPWHRYSPALLREARDAGTQPWKLENFYRIVDLVDRRQPVGPGDWGLLVRLAGDPSSDMRQLSLGLMAHLGYTGRRSEIIAIAKAHLEDPNPAPRSSALIALWRMDDPVWRQKVREWANSPDPLVQHTVHLLLERANRGRAQ